MSMKFVLNRSNLKRFERASFVGLQAAGEFILGEAIKIVPLDEGDLQRSGVVTNNGVDTVNISFNTPYARRLHENPQFNFQNGRQGKYLETPLQQKQQQAFSLMAAEIRRAAGS